MLLLLCFSRAQAAHVLEATHPHSRTPTESYKPMPSIPPNPPRLSARVVCAPRSAFNLFGVEGNMTVNTTYEGFATRLRIGDRTTTTPHNCESHTFEGVTLTNHWYKYVDNGVIFTFKLRNGGGQTQWVDLQVFADIWLDDMDGPPIQSLSGGRGLVAYTPKYVESVIVRGYTLVDDVSTVWFGNPSQVMLEAWREVEYDRYFEGDAAMSWTWQQMQIEPGRVITRSMIVLFGLTAQNTLHLHITSSLPDVIHATDTLHVSGTVTSST
jgi:hypothetical protein